jgi:Rod binding domain-containing protein
MSSISSQTQGINGVVDVGSLTKLRTIPNAKARAEAVAGQLESVFWGMMIKSMRDTVPKDELVDDGLGGSNYVEMLDQQLAQMQGLPRDPRFHETLVKQIMEHPNGVDAALDKLDQPAGGQSAKSAGLALTRASNVEKVAE